jgi:superfamily II DNA or RNA helicase
MLAHSLNMRDYQKSCNLAISHELTHSNRCLIKMFCGTGKSLVMRRCNDIQGLPLVVFVFPSLALIDQFYTNYLQPGSTTCDPIDQATSSTSILRVSCEKDATTQPEVIRHFLATTSTTQKYILVTYHSYDRLLDNLSGTIMDAVVFDEAHHTVSPTWKHLVYERTPTLSRYNIFFTATPRNVENIIMNPTTTDSVGNCGPLAFDYTYLDGLHDEYLNAFDVCADYHIRNDLESVLKSIARAIISSKNTRVLTFHADVNSESIDRQFKTVSQFVKLATKNKCFAILFKHVLETEFPEQIGIWKKTKITIKSLDAKVKGPDRAKIIDELDKTSDSNIFILASCQTIGEGVDTKRANMCVFIDPKTSHHQIIQNIGRIVRKPKGVTQPATILLPVWIDVEKYAEYLDDPVARDNAIREDMDNTDTGNYNHILNVVAALKTEDPDIADIILKYPTKFSPKEIQKNARKHKITIGDKIGDGSALETLNHLLHTTIVPIPESTPTELIEWVARQFNTCIEIHTDTLDNSVVVFNKSAAIHQIVRMIQIDENEFLPASSKSRKQTPSLSKTNRPSISAKADPEIATLWKLTNFSEYTRTFILSCVTISKVDSWRAKLEQLDVYIQTNNKRPTGKDKNPDVKMLGQWLYHQVQYYKNNVYIMTNPAIRSEWEELTGKYPHLFMSNEEEWRVKLDQLDVYIQTHGKRPTCYDKNTDVKSLGKWLSHQVQNYKNNVDIMSTNPTIRLEWEYFTTVKYPEHFRSNEEEWRATLEEVYVYIQTHGKRPTVTDKNTEVKTLSSWVSSQVQNYKNNVYIMTNPDLRSEWHEFTTVKYPHLFMSNEEVWRATFEEVDVYIQTHCRRPSEDDKNLEVNLLGSWVSKQVTNYKKNVQIMSNPEFRLEWHEFTTVKYPQYFKSNEEEWRATFEEVDVYIQTHGKRPSRSDKNPNIKFLGSWINTQNTNYKKNVYAMTNLSIRSEWEELTGKYPHLFMSNEEEWRVKLDQLDVYIQTHGKRPSRSDKIPEVRSLGAWINTQNQNYKKNVAIISTPEIRLEWEHFTGKYPQHFQPSDTDSVTSLEMPSSTPTPTPLSEPTPTPQVQPPKNRKKSMKLHTVKPGSIQPTKVNKESEEERRVRVKSKLSVLHQKYKTMTSSNLSAMFKATPGLWEEYHDISETNEQSFEPSMIPRNRIISELSNHRINPKRPKIVVDMGCGKAHISKHFEGDGRFIFHNYDHVSVSSDVTVGDISNLPLEDGSVDYCILSLAMWGSNCQDYLREAHRILDRSGSLYIIEPTKRWSETAPNGEVIKGSEGIALRNVLDSLGFVVKQQNIDKFCMIVCGVSGI